jgi:CysZ protein
LLGREYFELAAMRHVSAAEAKRLRKANKVTVLMCGMLIAGLASVPILNLVTPLFATGFMVRMYKRIAAKSGGAARVGV